MSGLRAALDRATVRLREANVSEGTIQMAVAFIRDELEAEPPVTGLDAAWANRIREDEAKRHDLYHALMADGEYDGTAREEAWPSPFDPLTEGGPNPSAHYPDNYLATVAPK